MNNINANARFISSYLGTKRKYGDKIAEVIKSCGEKTLYDVFGGSGSLTCQLAPYFDRLIYNEKNIFISTFIELAYSHFKDGTFDEWFDSSVKAWYIGSKERYFEIRERFNSQLDDFDQRCIQFFWLDHTCTSSLIRWNGHKIPGNPWYFNQAYNGKVVNADNIKETLKNGLACINNKEFEIHPDDYEDLAIEKGLLMVDPPYDNTYSDYLPENWDSERFVKWLIEKSKTNPVCLFGSTKVDDFSDTKNLKPFYDLGWKVLVLSEKAFKGVSPHGVSHDKAQDRSKQRDVMLYNF